LQQFEHVLLWVGQAGPPPFQQTTPAPRQDDVQTPFSQVPPEQAVPLATATQLLPQLASAVWHVGHVTLLQPDPAQQVPPHPSAAPHVFPEQTGVQPQTLAVPPPPQLCGDVQLPHERFPPHPSERVPQFFPCAAHVVGVHALHVSVTHEPLTTWVDPLQQLPQVLDCAAHAAPPPRKQTIPPGRHALEQTPFWQVPPEHAMPLLSQTQLLPHVASTVWQAGHVTLAQPEPAQQVPPHPSDAPHVFPEQVGVQPQTLAVPPPPQLCGAVQLPHERFPPQPSATEPQFFPWEAHVWGGHVTTAHAVPV
jgi:hypothetical protein